MFAVRATAHPCPYFSFRLTCPLLSHLLRVHSLSTIQSQSGRYNLHSHHTTHSRSLTFFRSFSYIFFFCCCCCSRSLKVKNKKISWFVCFIPIVSLPLGPTPPPERKQKKKEEVTVIKVVKTTQLQL
uniref:Uncharacterized protein n=1 Tax=Trypanosoma vivax (strain Y486) TaxID=1055687 RepID=G0U6P5_TRYVY|nr:hypothetical protein, unlikely [Trypanosoma vivax Y486]